jgi:hypothetical protein
VTLKFKAYSKKDGVSSEQEKACKNFNDGKLRIAEKLLTRYSKDAQTRFDPKTLLINRDGSYALLCDDKENPDDGIAVCLAPKAKIVSQDEYL